MGGDVEVANTPLQAARERVGGEHTHSNHDTVLALSDRINTHTRPLHTHLNRLILSRLPLALPPYTSNPSLYATGLFYIYPIYAAFEGVWKELLGITNQDSDSSPKHGEIDGGKNMEPRIRSLLESLHFDALDRTPKLRSDIQALLPILSSEEISGILETTSEPLAEFLDSVKRNIKEKPHVIMAYSWVLYMALFSGGRFLRASLQQADTEFWSTPASFPPSQLPSPSTQSSTGQEEIKDSQYAQEITRNHKKPSPELGPPIPGLSFFSFWPETEDDGEELKTEFKGAYREIEDLLTEGEKEEVVQAAMGIFEGMVGLIGVLDEVCGPTTSLETGRGKKNRKEKGKKQKVVENVGYFFARGEGEEGGVGTWGWIRSLLEIGESGIGGARQGHPSPLGKNGFTDEKGGEARVRQRQWKDDKRRGVLTVLALFIAFGVWFYMRHCR